MNSSSRPQQLIGPCLVSKLLVLNRNHDRIGFDCGNEALNAYLQNTARQHIDKSLATTRVIVDENDVTILGFYSITMCELDASSLPDRISRKLPNSKVPAALLGRLAVDRRHQGKGLGKALLMEAVRDTVVVANQVACVGLVVDSKNADSTRFYAAYGFEEIPGNNSRLFMPINTLKTIAAAIPSVS